MMGKGGLAALVCVVGLLARAAAVSALLVDDFTSATTDLMSNPRFGCTPGSGQGTCFITGINVAQDVVGSTTVTDAPLADVLGGSRTLTVFADSLQSITPPDQVVVGVVPLAGFLEYDSTAQADGRVELLYDANGSGLNLPLTTLEGVRVVVLDSDKASVECEGGVLNCTPGYEVTVTLTDALMNSASLTQKVLLFGPITLTFPIRSFANIQNLNVGSVFSLDVMVNPNTAGDLRLDRIEVFQTSQTTPLLSQTVLVILLGGLTLIAWRALAARAT